MNKKHHLRITPHLQVLLILALLLGLGLSSWPLTHGKAETVITVTSTLDNLKNDGVCTLREAIIAANKDQPSGNKGSECSAGNGTDTIILPAGTYTLTRTDNGKEDSSSTGDLDIRGDVLIQGTGPGDTIINTTDFTDRIFHVISGVVTLQGISIQGGNVQQDGGGIFNLTDLTLTNVEVSNNNAGEYGGGIFNAENATLSVSSSSIKNNNSALAGGGIYNQGFISSLSGSTIADNTGSGGAGGIQLAAPGNATIKGNTITSNSGDGVRVASGTENEIQENSIYDNAQLGINLSEDSITPNDTGDGDTGPNNLQNFPVLIRVVSAGDSLDIDGRLNSTPNTTFNIDLYSNQSCDPSGYGEGQAYLGTFSDSTDSSGNLVFKASFPKSNLAGEYITATATDPNGNTSEFSACATVTNGNDSWVTAYQLPLGGNPLSYELNDTIDSQGQSRWYKFNVQPGSKLVVTLTNLPANYDLTVYKDIAAAFESLTSPQDLVRLGAEFAPDAFSPDAFSPDAFSPDAFSPDAFSPDAFSPDAFSPDAFSPDAFSPDAFSPDAFSPDAFSPDAFSPDAFSPDAFSPDAFSPDAFSPDAFSPDAFSGAQMRSLIAVSAFDGTTSEGILVNTWNNTGDFYVRVRGRNGAFSLGNSFHLRISMYPGGCSDVNPDLPNTSLEATDGGFKTIILTDMSRMAGTDDEKAALSDKLGVFAGRPEVSGVMVDVSGDARVSAANDLADSHPQCPYAKNLVATAIKDIVNRYDSNNPLEYVVIVGNDEVIPFFRSADHALLANEQNYVPPVKDSSASQASLKLGFVLSQDRYGSRTDISLKEDDFPIPGMAVGRLVEMPTDIITMLDAYLGTTDGVVQPSSSLVTGYDFLADAAYQIRDEFSAGTGATPDTLITDRDVSPADPSAWTATDLEALLLDKSHDLIFLAGHFSANSALAADFTTRVLSTELANAPADFTNAIIFSAGCHSGYNIVDADGIPYVTLEPDWAQAFAQRGATLIAGTGYQYGDTDFLKYSERLYLAFSQQLRTGSGAVPVGKALVAAKQAYLSTTPYLRGIDEKALLEATLFGFPMLSVDMPGTRLSPPSDGSMVVSTTPFLTNPGAYLGLSYTDIHLTPSLSQHTVQLTDPATGNTSDATYFSGPDGILTNPGEPVLPLELENVSVSNTVLRGIGFRGGSFSDVSGILPLSGAAATEIRGVHTPFLSNVFYPIQPWSANYFNALANKSGGTTQLVLIPGQYKSETPVSPTGTFRKYSAMDFRLYYSNNTGEYAGGSVPALSAQPSISTVSAVPTSGAVAFQIKVVGNPAAGIQQVWVTYTAVNGPLAGQWQSLDLLQNLVDSTLWEGLLSLPNTQPEDLRFMVQGVNGVGLVSLSTNLGKYYVPGANQAGDQPTTLSLVSPPSSGAYSTSTTLSAQLTSQGSPLTGQVVIFNIGPQTRLAITGDDGIATANLSLYAPAGDTQISASFPGTEIYQASFDTSSFTIDKQNTQITLSSTDISVYLNDQIPLVATLSDVDGRFLNEETIFFVLSQNGISRYGIPVITDYAGRASFGNWLTLVPGEYDLTAYFGGNVPLPSENLTLTDDRYESSTATTTLTLLNHQPQTQDDEYHMDQNSTLNVPAPGVLANDSDLDGQSLTAINPSGPSHGTLTLNQDGSFTYTPSLDFGGLDTFTYQAFDGFDTSDPATVSIVVNSPPDCSLATPSTGIWIWPPNSDLVSVNVEGVTDPDGGQVSINIDGIYQDEPVGHDSNSPDGFGINTDTAIVRAERDGSGDGRVYHIYFTASDDQGGFCSSEIRVGVSDNQSGDLAPIDQGPLYNSTIQD